MLCEPKQSVQVNDMFGRCSWTPWTSGCPFRSLGWGSVGEPGSARRQDVVVHCWCSGFCRAAAGKDLYSCLSFSLYFPLSFLICPSSLLPYPSLPSFSLPPFLLSFSLSGGRDRICWLKWRLIRRRTWCALILDRWHKSLLSQVCRYTCVCVCTCKSVFMFMSASVSVSAFMRTSICLKFLFRCTCMSTHSHFQARSHPHTHTRTQTHALKTQQNDAVFDAFGSDTAQYLGRQAALEYATRAGITPGHHHQNQNKKTQQENRGHEHHHHQNHSQKTPLHMGSAARQGANKRAPTVTQRNI